MDGVPSRDATRLPGFFLFFLVIIRHGFDSLATGTGREERKPQPRHHPPATYVRARPRKDESWRSNRLLLQTGDDTYASWEIIAVASQLCGLIFERRRPSRTAIHGPHYVCEQYRQAPLVTIRLRNPRDSSRVEQCSSLTKPHCSWTYRSDPTCHVPRRNQTNVTLETKNCALCTRGPNSERCGLCSHAMLSLGFRTARNGPQMSTSG